LTANEDWITGRLRTDNPQPPEVPDAGDRSASQLALKTGPDALNRALRTPIQVALVEAVVVLVPLLLSVLDEGLSWADVARGGVRAALAAVLAWAMRHRFAPPAPAAAV